MTRIEVQGGGIIDATNDTGKPGAPTLANTDWYDTLTGYLDPVNQINSSMMFTIADSNLADFSDAAVFVHPAGAQCTLSGLDRPDQHGEPAFPARGGIVGEPVDLYMYNDTISNSNQGVHINSVPGRQHDGPNSISSRLAQQHVLQRRERDPDDRAAVQRRPTLWPASTAGMNNIFDGSSWIAVDLIGQDGGSQIQYNLFFTNAVNHRPDTRMTATSWATSARSTPIRTSSARSVPATRRRRISSSSRPHRRSTRPAARSGPMPAGNAIYPTTTHVNHTGTGGVITDDPHRSRPR